MATKKKVAKVEDHCGATCASCQWLVPESDAEAYCFAFPPTVTVDQNGDPWATRPVVSLSDPKCMFFKQRLDS